jgi:hypothetical protein
MITHDAVRSKPQDPTKVIVVRLKVIARDRRALR